MWLEIGCTNNNPEVIAKYFIDTVNQISGVPRIIRCDEGTENTLIQILQPYLRMDSDDAYAGEKSFLVGKSTSNQRIEAWWSLFRRGGAEWWIRLFKDLRDFGFYDDTNGFHCECLRFCFMDILRNEMYRIAVH